MEGLQIEKHGNSTMCTITHISDDLKDYIRTELTAICYGTENISDNEDWFSYESTIQEFLELYNDKTPETKMGIMGELLAHIVMKTQLPSLTSIGVMLNKEEYSIRKGFDLIHTDRNDLSIWYGEVKSGSKQDDQTATNSSRTLIHRAKRDLRDKLLTDRSRKHWQSARVDSRLTLAEPRARNVRELLTNDYDELSTSTNTRKNVVLVSTLFHDSQDLIDKEVIKLVQPVIASSEMFDQVLVITIQKSTVEALELFFRGELLHA